MKLRNKKTGEIGELHYEPDKEYHFAVAPEDPADIMIFKTLAELCEEWEDCKKRIAHLEGIQNVFFTPNGRVCIDYTTAKEAELAVEKLKALKRLKDKGFKFNSWTIPEEPKTPHIKLVIEAEMDVPDSPYDLDICFGGEDD